MKLWSLRCFDFCCFVLEFLVLFILNLFFTAKRANICFFYFFTHGASNGLGRWLTMQAWRPGLDPQREALVWWRALGNPVLESRQEDPWGLLISQLKQRETMSQKQTGGRVLRLTSCFHTYTHACTSTEHEHAYVYTQLLTVWSLLDCVCCVSPGLSYSCLLAAI